MLRATADSSFPPARCGRPSQGHHGLWNHAVDGTRLLSVPAPSSATCLHDWNLPRISRKTALLVCFTALLYPGGFPKRRNRQPSFPGSTLITNLHVLPARESQHCWTNTPHRSLRRPPLSLKLTPAGEAASERACWAMPFSLPWPVVSGRRWEGKGRMCLFHSTLSNS